MPRIAFVLVAWLSATPCLAAPEQKTASAEGVAVAVPGPTAEAKSYARGNLSLWFVNQGWAIAVPAFLLVSGTSSRLRSLARGIGRRWFAMAAIFAVLYMSLSALIDLPLDYYQGFWRQHAYGVSRKPVGVWLGDWLKNQGVGIGLAALFLWIPYLIIRKAPRSWWIWIGLICVPFLCAVALLKPVAFDPLFNRFGPMENRQLEAKILNLAGEAGIDGSRVFEVDKARETTMVNAYVTGLLGTKRIVIWDTLTAKLDDREVLFVVGHEIGHYVLNHVVSGLLVSSALILIGLAIVRAVASRLLNRSKARWGVDGLADVASLPLLIAVGQVVAIVLTPIGFAYSRHIEHEADRFALEITRANHSGATGFSKIQRENLSLPRPDPFSVIMRSTHPSLADRIEFCNDYHPWRDGRPLVYERLFRRKPSP